MSKDLTGQPVPVVPTSEAQQMRRFLAFAAMAAGAALKTVAENAPAIALHYPNVKWVGGALFVAGLVWKAWQSFGDTGNVTHVDLSPAGKAATTGEFPEDGNPTP